MKKGDTLIANTTNHLWNIKKGDRLVALSDERFRNGETEIKTSRGWIPAVFFYELPPDTVSDPDRIITDSRDRLRDKM